MDKTKLKPSFFVLRVHCEDLYLRKLKDTDLVILMTLHDKASPQDGIATISYHGIGDLIGKPTNTVKNSLTRLSELGKVVIELPKQGQRAFRVGVVDYWKKYKEYTTALQFEQIFNERQGDFCKVGNNNAKSDYSEVAKSDTADNKAKSPQEWIKIAKSELDKSAKSIDIDVDRDIELNKDIELDEDKNIINTRMNNIGECLSGLNNSSGVGLMLKARGGQSVINGFDLTSHPDWETLINEFGEGTVINFIEQTRGSCNARTLGQAFCFVFKGLKSRKEREKGVGYGKLNKT